MMGSTRKEEKEEGRVATEWRIKRATSMRLVSWQFSLVPGVSEIIRRRFQVQLHLDRSDGRSDDIVILRDVSINNSLHWDLPV